MHTPVTDWLVANPSPLGGPGIMMEFIEAKFGKRKYNDEAYQEGQWVLGGVDSVHGQCRTSWMVLKPSVVDK